MTKINFITVLVFFVYRLQGQDTFSILAFDSVTREVGAAGASCVDLDSTPFSDHFIAELFPDSGAVVSQASYIQANQFRARMRMRAGDSPAQIISYMIANDIQANPSVRQYGALKFGDPTAAYTGSNCLAYMGHITGPNYSIQGNILLGKVVLDSMEARFLRADGDLACKLMAAMQGAKMPGADARCMDYNSSSLFAFLKVMLPADTFGKPSFVVSVRTQPGDSIEPIDSLQTLFDQERSCKVDDTGLQDYTKGAAITIIPNPATDYFVVKTAEDVSGWLRVTDISGRVVEELPFRRESALDAARYGRGLYFVEIRSREGRTVRKLLVE